MAGACVRIPALTCFVRRLTGSSKRFALMIAKCISSLPGLDQTIKSEPYKTEAQILLFVSRFIPIYPRKIILISSAIVMLHCL